MSVFPEPLRPPPLPPPAPPVPRVNSAASRRAPAPEKALRQLFLTLFLRGRAARGLQKQSAPRSVGQKLALTLGFYALLGCLVLPLSGRGMFTLSVYLHAMTLMFIGMFAASSAGEVLFNREEADILLHRPISARSLLWAKVAVLVEVSLWLALAFNLAGLLVGWLGAGGSWRYPLAHLASTALLALFCVSSVVLVYELCLRWFGRERLDALMTTAQVVMALLAVLGGQLAPRLLEPLGRLGALEIDTWWIWLLPPAWFGGMDVALAANGLRASWLLGALGTLSTLALMWLVFGRLSREYGAGLQTLNENVRRGPRAHGRQRWLQRLTDCPPLRVCLGDSVSRATFLLVAAYLLRDRDVKLRVYPGIAPLLIMPLIMLWPGRGSSSGAFGVAFAGAYLGIIPLLGIGLLQYSQQWQAADVFRAAPLAGPASLLRGLRRAVLLILVGPALVVYALLCLILVERVEQMALLLPGLVAIPLFALVPCLTGQAVPLANPVDQAKSTGHGMRMVGAMLASAVLAGLSILAWSSGWFLEFMVIEALGVAGVLAVLRPILARAPWKIAD